MGRGIVQEGMKTLFAALLLFLSSCSTVWLSTFRGPVPAAYVSDQVEIVPGEKLYQIHGTQIGAKAYIGFSGTAKNLSDEDWTDVTLVFTTYSEEGDRVSEARASIAQWNSGESWDFQAVVNENYGTRTFHKTVGLPVLLIGERSPNQSSE